MCTLSVKVKDKNDNKPIFDRGQYDEPVAQDTPVGTQIMRVSATDVDEGENQKISYDLSATRIPGLLIIFFVCPCGVWVEHWPCNPKVSGSIPGTGNLKSCLSGRK